MVWSDVSWVTAWERLGLLVSCLRVLGGKVELVGRLHLFG
jgi:hypothetical protein